MSVLPDTAPVPVSWDVHGGFSRAVGTAAVADTDLVLHLRTQMAGGLFTTRERTVRVDLTDLDAVRHLRRLTCDVLELHARDLGALRDVPGAAGTTVRMSVKREHRDLLLRLLDRLSLWM